MSVLGKPEAARGFPWTALVLGVIGIAILLSLGTWQLQRLAWKEALIASIDQRTHSEPRPLSAVERQFAETGDVDYWPVEVEGTFDHAKERHFFATYEGQPGFYVYTPLKLADGRFILINRGFVPYDRKDVSTRLQGQVEGTVTLKGLARNPLAAKPSFLIPENEPDKNIFYWKDRDTMARSAGLDTARLLPFFIDADKAPNPGGLPVGGVTIVDMPNNHLQYAVTWYGLAAALAAVLGAWLWRTRNERRA
ncbi:SURF1 family protein [Mesorhizobium sp. BAC0120]|uniref:SURF1 family protein n=1 Tax=Mesorhizobium sp. BAC0120 TaxID=3090670 RepID=UPI00298C3989|nr:SURF1 family protein [Mesorhizobium sp. BAC0120]MDW6020917.1 SURF1 family protein [Mesorhizobium sp. BAC0120]